MYVQRQGRAYGKTEEIIRHAARTGGTILCSSHTYEKMLTTQAKQMGLKITTDVWPDETGEFQLGR